MKPGNLIRSGVRKLHAYVPGEQPRVRGLVKLNTNENPYPPAPAVLNAVKRAVDGRLRLYPDPTARPLREKLARLHGCKPENILVGNGSDELLALATRAFVEPLNRETPTPHDVSRFVVQYFTPSYSLYPVLADIHGAIKREQPLNAAFDLPTTAELKRGGRWDFRAALTLVTTPNAPSGRGYTSAELDRLCRAQKRVTVLDEAYVDFADEHAMELAFKHPHVLVSRTFSKAYSLCFQRVGYFVGHPDLIAAMNKIRDSYNVNGLGQVAAEATLDRLSYYRKNFREIIATRRWLTDQLAGLGFETLPSGTNFILTRPPGPPAAEWLVRLRARKFLVRWFDRPEVRDYLRVTIGTPVEMRRFARAAAAVVADR